ncbi:HU family DNA-binding protein [Fodinibius salsisoli]|uniref:HU family DNA-binding protein n=1 Tax=Fodinibius salsisoli TaxID=2820877 RepID=A0ABT3PRE6_9BACT|nr:HU family DNA-binding protein [Fodinibius salsisoli]MCW9708438.1 HU family DNA-binding protein [Fodinibius salsisoli]
MTIDNEQLISLLAERTGFDQGRIDEQFAELIDRIQQAETEEDSLHLKGFGTFEFINDRLEFKPADVLQVEVNNKYTGMKPIELIGAFKEPGGGDVPIADFRNEEEVLDYKDLPEEQQIEKTEPEVEEEKQPEVTAEVQTEASVPEAEQSKEGHAEQEQQAPALAGEASTDADETDESLQKDPLGKAILILAVIVALAVAGWMAYDLGLFGSSTENDTPQEPVEEQTEALDPSAPPQSTEQDQSPADNPEAEQEQGQGSALDASANPTTSGAVNNESPPSTVEDTPYGLYGEFNQNINTGYFTIVVHSLQTMDLAEEKKQGLASEGFRTKINEASVDGQTYFRVGIGQFLRVQDAAEAVQELPEPYKSNNFINRF